jgi:L-lysine 6-transaminase
MQTKTVTNNSVAPLEVPGVIGKHMLVDMLDFVVDLKKSEGSYIYDSKSNRRLLDFFTFVASMPIGLNHPKMMTPEFMEKMAYVAINKPTNSDVYTTEMAEFLQVFSRVAIPDYLPHAFFIEGGAMAVENALKTAFDWKIRKNFMKGIKEEKGRQIIHFKQAFHGRSGYTMSLTNTDPVKTDLFPKFSWPRVAPPTLKFPLSEENILAAEKAEAQTIAQIKEAIHANKDDIAAIILEPIQGEGGDNHFRKEFFLALRALADEHDILLILDEVQTGIGLTGKMWAHQHFVKPDIISFGKKMQVCGILAGPRLDEVPDNVFRLSSRLNSTWGGGLVDMVRAQRYLEIIEEDNLIENARVMGDHLQKGLATLQAEFPNLVSNARGRGLFCAIDIRSAAERTELRNQAFARGLVVLGSGERSLRFRPPLTISKHELDEGLGILRQSLKEMKA